MKSRNPPWQANLQAAMGELIKGQHQATRLLSLLKDLLSSESEPDSAGLLVEVVASFSKALSYLELEKAAMPPPLLLDSPNPSDGKRTQQTSCAKKKKTPAPRRSGHRRRMHPYTCRTVFVNKTDDGYTWRKYGQKDIYGAMYPRSYYRCVHRNDQGCQVTRQVQKTEEDPSIFAIIYMGEHTCTDSKKSPDEQRANDQKPESAPPSSTLIPSPMKQESEEEVMSSHSTGSSNSSELTKSQDIAAAAATAAAAAAAVHQDSLPLPVLSHFIGATCSDLVHDLRSGSLRSTAETSISLMEIDPFAPEAFKFEDLFQFNQYDYHG